MQKILPKMVNPRDVAGNIEEEEDSLKPPTTKTNAGIFEMNSSVCKSWNSKERTYTYRLGEALCAFK